MIVRVDATIAASGIAQPFAGAIRQHLVRVHVVRGAGTGLIHVDNELIAKGAAENLVGSPRDGAADARVEPPERHVGLRGGFLYKNGRRDEIG